MIKTLMLSTAILGSALVPAAAQVSQSTRDILLQGELAYQQQQIWNNQARINDLEFNAPSYPPPGRWVRVWVGTPNNPSPNVYYFGE